MRITIDWMDALAIIILIVVFLWCVIATGYEKVRDAITSKIKKKKEKNKAIETDAEQKSES